MIVSLVPTEAARVAWQWSGADPADAAPPRVLAVDATERLARVNAVVRRLRGWGIRTAHIDVRLEPPAVRLDHNTPETIAPLLDAAGPRTFLPRHGRATLVYCLLDRVAVCWELPR